MYRITFQTRKGEVRQYGPLLLNKDEAINKAKWLRDEQGYSGVKLTGLLPNLPKPGAHIEVKPKHLDEACTMLNIMCGSALYKRIEAHINSPKFDAHAVEPRVHVSITRGDTTTHHYCTTEELSSIRLPGDHVEIKDSTAHRAWEVSKIAYKLALVNYCPRGEIASS